MTSTADGFIACLKASAPLTAIVKGQIYAMFAPTDATGTWLVLTRISGLRTNSHGGDDLVSRARYQVNIGGSDKTQTDAAREALIALNGTETILQDGLRITLLHEDDREHWDEALRQYINTVDFYVWTNN